MSCTHVEYEMLCAFATAGQLSEVELNDLSEHLNSCSSCQQHLTEMEVASYAYFLRHADNAKGVGTPPGLQQRFEERAGSMGISLRDTTAALPGTRFISLALSVLLLIIAAQVGWTAFYPQIGEQAVVPVRTASNRPFQTILKAPGSVFSDPPVHKGLSANLSGSQSIKVVRHAFSHTSPQHGVRKVLSNSPPLTLLGLQAFAGVCPLSPHGLVRGSLTAGAYLPEKGTFKLTEASHFRGVGEYSTSEKQTFRYSPIFASLSFLGVPERVKEPRLPAMNEPPPLFHLNSTKAW